MSEKESENPDTVTITVTPSASHPDVLSVQDAMRQVLDCFDLLTPESDEFLWRLTLASTNSPLTVQGQPYIANSPAEASKLAFEQKSVLEESFRALSEGRPPKRRLTSKRREAIRRIFRRNMDGIGKTEIVLLRAEAPVFVTPSIAEISVDALNKEEESEFQSLLLKDRARSEMGSLEGTLVEVGTDYMAPAVLIRERNTGEEIWCRVSADIRDKISSQTTLNDVWTRSRVVVRGRIRYDSDGTIKRVWAHDLNTLKPRVVDVGEIADREFTSGNTIHDYLERLREGDLG